MFDTYQRLSIAKLTDVRAGNSDYDDLLDTDLGREFVENVSSPIIVKRYAGYIAAESSTVTRSATTTTGFGCVPSKSPISLNSKLNVLTCLIILTPHSFWAGKTLMVNNALILKNRIDNPNVWPQYSFLGYGDFDECTTSLDGPRYACRKHDVAFASLQKFQGAPTGDELDESWNPRNKSLTDIKFLTDVKRYGCQDPSWNARISFCLFPQTLASVYFWGVAKSASGHRGWPVTNQDLTHIINNPQYTQCANPYLPSVSDLTFSGTGTTLTARWNFEPGCIVGLDDIDFSLWLMVGTTIQRITVDPGAASTPCTTIGLQVVCSYTIPSSSYIHYVLVRIQSKQLEYGPLTFPTTVGRAR